MRQFLFASCAILAALPAFAATQMEELAATMNVGDYPDAVERLIKNNREAQALELANIGLQKNPKSAQLSFMRAVALEKLGRTKEAIKELETLIATYPEIPEPYNNLAVIEAGLGNLERARTLLIDTLNINPSFALARKNLGDVYLSLSLEAYEKAAPSLKGNNVLQRRLETLRRLTQ